MTPFQYVLCAGAAHSATNARNIRAWIAEAKPAPGVVAAMVADWRKRNFLTDKDARELAGA